MNTLEYKQRQCIFKNTFLPPPLKVSSVTPRSMISPTFRRNMIPPSRQTTQHVDKRLTTRHIPEGLFSCSPPAEPNNSRNFSFICLSQSFQLAHQHRSGLRKEKARGHTASYTDLGNFGYSSPLNQRFLTSGARCRFCGA
jgi:hypothetical protein